MPKFDPIFVQQQIAALLLAHPELEEDEQLRADMIEGVTDTFEFLAAIVRKIGATQAIAAGTAEYIGQLQERKARLERREYVLRQLIHKVMDAGHLTKAELPEATLSIRNGVPKVVIVNEHEIPDQYMRIRKEPDKTAIKNAMKYGNYIPGAAISNAEPTLQIRTT